MGHNRGFQTLTPPLDFNVDLAPDLSPLGGIFEDIGGFVQQGRERKAAQERAQDVARTTLEALEDQPSGEAATNDINRNFDGLSGINPRRASEVSDALRGGDVDEMNELRNEAADEVLLSEAIQKLPSHAAQLNRFRQFVVRKGLEGDELIAALGIMNSSPDDFKTAMVKMQAEGGSILALLPEPQRARRAPSARNQALARLSAIAPKRFKDVADVIGARETRRATAAETERKRNLPQSQFGKEFADVNRLMASGDISQAEGGRVLDNLFSEAAAPGGGATPLFAMGRSMIIQDENGQEIVITPVTDKRTGITTLERNSIGESMEFISRLGETPEEIQTRAGETEKVKVVGAAEGEILAGDLPRGRRETARARRATKAQERKFNFINDTIDTAIGQANSFTAGIGSTTSGIPGSPAANLAATLQTISANVGFGALQTMRDNSPTGGALGQVSERELALLTATWGNVMNSQSPGQLKHNLRVFKKQQIESFKEVKQAFEDNFDVPFEGFETPVPGAGGDGGDLVFNPETGRLE